MAIISWLLSLTSIAPSLDHSMPRKTNMGCRLRKFLGELDNWALATIASFNFAGTHTHKKKSRRQWNRLMLLMQLMIGRLIHMDSWWHDYWISSYEIYCWCDIWLIIESCSWNQFQLWLKSYEWFGMIAHHGLKRKRVDIPTASNSSARLFGIELGTAMIVPWYLPFRT